MDRRDNYYRPLCNQV